MTLWLMILPHSKIHHIMQKPRHQLILQKANMNISLDGFLTFSMYKISDGFFFNL